MAPKRKAPKKKTAKTPRARTPRASNPRKRIAPGNASTPVQDHPYTHLSISVRRNLDTTNYGFKRVRIPTVPLILRFPRPKFFDNPATVAPFMRIMTNKLFHLRNYFLPEVKALIWRNIDRGPRTVSETALLAELAKGVNRGRLGVSYLAQDCVRLILYYAALFEMEDKARAKGEEGYTKGAREAELKCRGEVWEKLRVEIGEQLPGDKKVRGERAEAVLKKVFRLASEEEGEEVVGVGKGWSE